MAPKKQNKRLARKRAVKMKWGLFNWDWPWAKRDTSKAAQRKWGQGAGK